MTYKFNRKFSLAVHSFDRKSLSSVIILIMEETVNNFNKENKTIFVVDREI
jgi:hypothetical protein